MPEEQKNWVEQNPPEKSLLRQRPKKSVDRQDIHLFQTRVLRALSDETRQGIIVLLGKQGPLFVNDIAAYFNVSRPTISHHLQVLRQARIVRSQKKGKEIYYYLNVRFLRRTIQNVLRLLDSIADEKAPG